jgi:ribokinase
MSSMIVVIGSLNADFVIDVPRFPVPGENMVGGAFQVFPGGKGANQAYAVARLGGKVSMIGQVGMDSHGDRLKQNLASAGVDVSHVHHDPTVSTGIATITTNAQGQNQIILVPGANGTFGPDQLKRSQRLIAAARLVLLQLEIPLETVQAAATLARQAGALVILDPAPARQIPDSLLACADYITPNETELAILTGLEPRDLDPAQAAELAGILLGRGARKVLVKMGAQGALLISGQHLERPHPVGFSPSPAHALDHFWPALPVTAVDTTAAGDAFNAAFACALADGQPELEAGLFAAAAAACSVLRAGAQPSMPTRDQVNALLKRG